MGHYAQFYIDNFTFEWKSFIPSFVAYLFSESDFKYDIDTDATPYKFRYETKAATARSNLEAYGITIEAIAGVYSHFYDELYNEYAERIMDLLAEKKDYKLSEVALQKQFTQFYKQFEDKSKLDQILDFIKFLSVLHSNEQTAIYTAKIGKRIIQISSAEYQKDIDLPIQNYIDMERLHMFIFGRELDLPPWISLIANLFDDYYFIELTDVIQICLVRLLIEASPESSAISLDISEITQDKETSEIFHSDATNFFVKKLSLYSNFFSNLIANEENIRTKFIKNSVSSLLMRNYSALSRNEKGKLLENLSEILFSSSLNLELIEKRATTGDEEIDLVFKNNIDRPFWLSLNSPLIFVECKNWSTVVGAKEIRDFETKIRNHSMAKLGYFFSMNGYSSECLDHLKRMSREEIRIILLDKSDILEFLKPNTKFYDWLEKKTSTLY